MTMNDQPRKRKQRPTRLWLIGLAILLLAAAAIVLWHTKAQEKQQEKAQTRPPSVTVTLPKPAPTVTTLTLPATLQAWQETPIYARTNGYLSHWHHDIGDTVRKGDLLADIDTPDIDQQFEQTSGALRQAEANLSLAKVTADRWKSLLQQNAVAQQDSDEKQANYFALLATAESARADMRRLEYLRSFKKLYAPFDGIVTERTVENGALINSGNSGSRELFKVAEIDIVKTYIGVPQSMERQIVPGVEAEIALKEFPDHTFKGRVTRSSREIDPVARTLQTEIDIPNPTKELLPGMYAEAKFHFPAPQASLIVPANVIVIHTGAPQVITVDNDNKLHFTNVVIGRDFGQETEIIQGLTADTRILNNPNDSLVENETVAVETPQAETPKPPKQDSENGKQTNGKQNSSTGASEKSNDEGKAPKKDNGGTSSGGGADSGVMDSNDKLPDSYTKPPDQGNAKKDGQKGGSP